MSQPTEDRQAAYLELVQTLLECPQHQEDRVLDANPGLVDEGLVKALLDEATRLKLENNPERVSSIEWLVDFAKELEPKLSAPKAARQVAYQTLIHNLLECPQHQEDRVLDANPELVDEGLVKALLDEANRLEAENDPEQASSIEWLTHFAAELEQKLQAPTQVRAAAYLTLVETLLECPQNTEDRVLDANPDLVDEGLVKALLDAADLLRAENDPELIPSIEWLANFAEELVQKLDLDMKATATLDREDYEKFSLALLYRVANSEGDYKIVHEFLDEHLAYLNKNLVEIFPALVNGLLAQEKDIDRQSAIGQLLYNFAIDLDRFPRGDRSINLQLSIACRQSTLNIRDRANMNREDYENFFMDLLQTVVDTRENGELVADFLDDHIICLNENFIPVFIRQAEMLLDRQEDREWKSFIALTLGNLGNEFQSFPRGERRVNLELSIACYDRALVVHTHEKFPLDWATTHNNRATAYSERIEGERRANLEEAIQGYDAALQEYSQEKFPRDWATTQHNRATAYKDRLEGDRESNLQIAIAGYEQTLLVYTEAEFPVEWDTTQENLELAIADYQAILTAREHAQIDPTQQKLCTELEARIFSPKQDQNTHFQQDEDDYWQVCLKLLQAVARSSHEEKIVKKLLNRQHIYLDQTFLAFFPRFIERLFTQFKDSETTVRIASYLNSLAIELTQFTKGNRSINLELAIACCDGALLVRNKQQFPIAWAVTESNRATAYRERIEGDRLMNLQAAIAGYERALSVYDRHKSPIAWAANQANLTAAIASYQTTLIESNAERIEVESPEDSTPVFSLVKAPRPTGSYAVKVDPDLQIDSNRSREDDRHLFLDLFQVVRNSEGDEKIVHEFLDKHLVELDRTFVSLLPEFIDELFDRFKDDKTQAAIASDCNSLAVDISQFPRGNLSVNLEISIVCYDRALLVYTRRKFPIDWATTQNNRAVAYKNRIEGDRRENLEVAIAGYEAALLERSRAKFPIDWARTQNNRAIAYKNRIEGDRRENLEVAIGGYEAALLVYTREQFPRQWATTQNNRAIAYSERIEGDRRENLEVAIRGYDLALLERSQEQDPIDWAMTQYNRANAYSERIEGDRRENLTEAIAGYDRALLVRNKADFPIEWAATESNRATAYQYRIDGETPAERLANLEIAIGGYQRALSVYTDADFPAESTIARSHLQAAIASYDGILAPRNADNDSSIDRLALSAAKSDPSTADPIPTPEEDPQIARIKLVHTLLESAPDREEQILDTHAELVDEELVMTLLAMAQIVSEQNDPNSAGKIQWLLNCAEKLGHKLGIDIGDSGESIDSEANPISSNLDRSSIDSNPDISVEPISLTTDSNPDISVEPISLTTDSNVDISVEPISLTTDSNVDISVEPISLTTDSNVDISVEPISLATDSNPDISVEPILLATDSNSDISVEPILLATDSNADISVEPISLTTDSNVDISVEPISLATDSNIDISVEPISLTTDSNVEQLAVNIVEPQETVATAANQQIADFDLVQLLIQCPKNEENRILAAYPELVTPGLVMALLATAQVSIDRNEPALELKIKWLVNFAQQLARKLGVEIKAEEGIVTIDPDRTSIQSLEISNSLVTTQLTQEELLQNALSTHENALQTAVKAGNFKSAIESIERIRNRQLEGNHTVESIDFASIQKLITTPDTAILNCYTTAEDTYIFIIKQSGEPTLHTAQDGGWQEFQHWLQTAWVNPAHENLTNWAENLPRLLHKIADKLQINTLINQHLTDISSLIIVPHLNLHQIPFAALPLNPLLGGVPEGRGGFLQVGVNPVGVAFPKELGRGGFLLGDKFTVSSIPSCQILKSCQLRPPVATAIMGTVEDASDGFLGAKYEGEQIAALYNIPTTNRLIGSSQSTPANYRALLARVNRLHASHHTTSNLDKPLESALILGNGEQISLADLLAGEHYPHLDEVYLAAGESPLSTTTLTEDVPSLPSAFLSIGARSVQSTLWSVDDLISLIFNLFYHQQRRIGVNPATALQTAQSQLRNLTGEQFEQIYYPKIVKYITAHNPALLGEYEEQLIAYCETDRPFDRPFYWAAFITQGAN